MLGSGGTIELRGEDITGKKAHQLVSMGVGYVPQTKNVFQTLTVRRTSRWVLPEAIVVRRALRVRHRPVPHRAVWARALSGGERQIVAMGRALMMQPTVLLLDEPSAGLSPILQDEVFLQCKRINQTGVAILMVEQNATRCLQVCHRGYVLDQGRNAYTGTGRQLLADPNVIELYLGTLAKATGS